MTLEQLIREAAERPLSQDEAEAAFTEIMEGRASPVQMAALLVTLRVRGPVADELAGGVRALRTAMISVATPHQPDLVDTCGTGGGTLTTFNISTAAALLAAGAGVLVAKHGNRSFTSRCGSADVLEVLGVRLDLSPQAEARVLDEAGIVFMFAPLHHPAMRHVAPIRRELAMPTVMNVLGPLTNPALARRQVVGVADPKLLELIANTLRVLGHERALVVHGEPGLDELSPLGPTRILELVEGEIRDWSFDPREELGWPHFEPRELAGGSQAENAAMVAGVLKGEVGGAARAAVLLNAGAALYVGGKASTLPEGVHRAELALDRGAGWERLEALRVASARAS
jgi:anthranilate phosphoribosyltransferase